MNAISYARNGGHQVYAFEPTQSKLVTIRKNLAESGVASNVTLFDVALSNYTGQATFWVSDSGSEQDTLSRPKWDGAVAMTVRVARLDDFVGPSASVLYAKIDAQGHDPEVLLGAEQLLSSQRLRTLAFEVWPGGSAEEPYAQAMAMLARHGYVCHDCSRPVHKGIADHGPWPVDAVLRNISLGMKRHRGVNHGEYGVPYTDFVCFARGVIPATPHGRAKT